MQVYALSENRLISAIKAEKSRDYRCPECLGLVRLREKKQCQSHFFHLNHNSSCRQSQKGQIHLHLQNFVKNLFEEAEIEKSFPEIGRIADVANSQTETIYEVQCSPISLGEAQKLCADYESLGYQVIWILHDHRFNQKKVTPSEEFLRTKTCYFSNMDIKGSGIIYDQLDQIIGRQRRFVSHRKQIHLQIKKTLPSFKWPKELSTRENTWPLYHEGDLFDHVLRGEFRSITPPEKKKLLLRLKEAYLAGFYMLLDKSSK